MEPPSGGVARPGARSCRRVEVEHAKVRRRLPKGRAARGALESPIGKGWSRPASTPREAARPGVRSSRRRGQLAPPERPRGRGCARVVDRRAGAALGGGRIGSGNAEFRQPPPEPGSHVNRRSRGPRRSSCSAFSAHAGTARVLARARCFSRIFKTYRPAQLFLLTLGRRGYLPARVASLESSRLYNLLKKMLPLLVDSVLNGLKGLLRLHPPSIS